MNPCWVDVRSAAKAILPMRLMVANVFVRIWMDR
jgi:hypothetical protein